MKIKELILTLLGISIRTITHIHGPWNLTPPRVQLVPGHRVPVGLDRLLNKVVLGPRLTDLERRSIYRSIRTAKIVDSELRPSPLLVLPDRPTVASGH